RLLYLQCPLRYVPYPGLVSELPPAKSLPSFLYSSFPLLQQHLIIFGGIDIFKFPFLDRNLADIVSCFIKETEYRGGLLYETGYDICQVSVQEWELENIN